MCSQYVDILAHYIPPMDLNKQVCRWSAPSAFPFSAAVNNVSATFPVAVESVVIVI
jgi:hypothetical protein